MNCFGHIFLYIVILLHAQIFLWLDNKSIIETYGLRTWPNKKHSFLECCGLSRYLFFELCGYRSHACLPNPWSSVVEWGEGCIRENSNLLCLIQSPKNYAACRHSIPTCLTVVAAVAPLFRLCLQSQAQYPRFFQFVLLKLYRENNENKPKEAGIGPFLNMFDGWTDPVVHLP